MRVVLTFGGMIALSLMLFFFSTMYGLYAFAPSLSCDINPLPQRPKFKSQSPIPLTCPTHLEPDSKKESVPQIDPQ